MRLKRGEIELPDFGSTVQCSGCGRGVFTRTYEPNYEDVMGLGPYMLARCDVCGWEQAEKMWFKSHA